MTEYSDTTVYTVWSIVITECLFQARSPVTGTEAGMLVRVGMSNICCYVPLYLRVIKH